MIFFSEGVRGLGSDATRCMADVVRAANESNTAIYTVDPRGLTARGASDSLYVLAENTGGRTIANTNGLDVALRAGRERGERVLPARLFVDQEPGGRQVPSDQGAGRISPGSTCAPGTATGRRARRRSTRPRRRPRRRRRRTPWRHGARALTPATSRHVLDLWTGARARRRTADAARGLWRGGRRTTSRRPGRGAGGGHGHCHGTGVAVRWHRSISAGPRFPVEPGDVKVAADRARRGGPRHRHRDAHREGSGQLAGQVAAVGITRAPSGGRRQSRCARSTAIPDAPPFAGHEFSRADRLLVRVALFGDAADATVAGRLAGSARPATRRAARSHRSPAAPGSYQIDLPLSSVAPGDYVIAVEASKGSERAEAFVAIRVAG